MVTGGNITIANGFSTPDVSISSTDSPRLHMVYCHPLYCSLSRWGENKKENQFSSPISSPLFDILASWGVFIKRHVWQLSPDAVQETHITGKIKPFEFPRLLGVRSFGRKSLYQISTKLLCRRPLVVSRLYRSGLIVDTRYSHMDGPPLRISSWLWRPFPRKSLACCR